MHLYNSGMRYCFNTLVQLVTSGDLALKVVAVAYERKSLTRGFKYSAFTQESFFIYFGKPIAEDRLSLTRTGDRNRISLVLRSLLLTA